MEETGLGSEDEDEDLKVKEFEQDYNTLSTPRLRLLEAQLFDEQTHLESRREEEDETDLLENILEQNREEVADFQSNLKSSLNFSCRSMLRMRINLFFANSTLQLIIFKNGNIDPPKRTTKWKASMESRKRN
jgi:hypothetical protein